MSRCEAGRPVSDPEWSALLDKSQWNLPSDGSFEENANMVQEWWDCLRHWHGCVIHPRNRGRATESVWTCRFYLAGEQRVIGRGTLYQCARLYDAAQVHYAKYRTGKPAHFNFDDGAQAKSDQCNADFVNFFGAIADLFEARGIILTTAEQRSEHSRLKTLDRQHDTRTATGRIEARLTTIEQAGKLRDDTLARIETRLNTLSAQLALLHSLPAVVAPSAETLIDAKNNLVSALTPIENSVSCNL